MKKSILFVLLLFSVIAATAQESRFTFGVSAGGDYNFSSMDTYKGSSKNMWGYRMGIDAEYQLNKTVYLQSGLYYSTKSTEFYYTSASEGGSGTYYYTDKMNPGYLELPLMIALKAQLCRSFRLYFRGGFYFAEGISGKYKSTDVLIDDGEILKTTKTEESIFGKHELHRFDWGLSFGTGVEIKRFTVGINVGVGLRNVGSDFHYGGIRNKYKNRTLSLTVGYRF